MYIIIEIENNRTLFQWTNNFIIYLISRVSSQFQIFLPSTVIRKKRLSYRCYRITIRTIFSFYPTYFQTKTRWNQLNRRNEVIRRKCLVASPILLTCVTGLLADSTIPVESCSTSWQLPWEVERKQLLSAPASHFCSNRDRDEEKFGLGSWVKLLSLWHGMEKREGGRIVERRGRKERRKINKERFLKNSCYWKTRCRLVWI